MACNFIKKDFNDAFSYEVYEIFKNTSSYRTTPVTVSAPAVAASVFNEKKQLFCNLIMTYKYFFLLDTSLDV